MLNWGSVANFGSIHTLSKIVKIIFYRTPYDLDDIVNHLDGIRKSNYQPYIIDREAFIVDKVRALKQRIYNKMCNREMVVKVLEPIAAFAEENAPPIYSELRSMKCWLFGQPCNRDEFKKLLDPVENPAEFIAQ